MAPPRDIRWEMESEPRGEGRAAVPTDRGASGRAAPSESSRTRLSAHEFAVRFQESSRALWCIAVGVTGDRAGADDLVQEAAVVALGKLDEFDPATSFTAWAGQIVRFLALNARRRAPRSRAAGGDRTDPIARIAPIAVPGGIATVTSRGQLADDQAAFDDDLAAAVRALDEHPRACLLMKVVLGLSYREISIALGIPEGTAMSHVHRARAALRRALDPDRRPGQGDAAA